MSGCCCEKCHHEAFIQRAAEADGNGDVFDVLGYPAVSFQVYGVLAGGSDVNFEFLSGTDWYALPVVNASTGVASATGIVTAEGTYIANTVGLQKVRARISGYGGADSVNVVATAVCEGDGTTVGGPSGGGGPTNDVNVNEWGGTATTLGQKVMDESVPVVFPSDQVTMTGRDTDLGGVKEIGTFLLPGALGPSGGTYVNLVDPGTGAHFLIDAAANIDELENLTAVHDPTLGTTADAAVPSGVGTISGKLRALVETITAIYNATAAAVRTIPSPSTTANTPSIVTAAATDAFAANAARKVWSIQNMGTNTLYVRLGTAASTTVFHFALKPGTVNDDGNGGYISDEIWKGIVSYAGTSPRFVYSELT